MEHQDVGQVTKLLSAHDVEVNEYVGLVEMLWKSGIFQTQNVSLSTEKISSIILSLLFYLNSCIRYLWCFRLNDDGFTPLDVSLMLHCDGITSQLLEREARESNRCKCIHVYQTIIFFRFFFAFSFISYYVSRSSQSCFPHLLCHVYPLTSSDVFIP